MKVCEKEPFVPAKMLFQSSPGTPWSTTVLPSSWKRLGLGPPSAPVVPSTSAAAAAIKAPANSNMRPLRSRLESSGLPPDSSHLALISVSSPSLRAQADQASGPAPLVVYTGHKPGLSGPSCAFG